MPHYANKATNANRIQMDLSKFKGKTIDDAALAELQAGFDAQKGRADTAESKARDAARDSSAKLKAAETERNDAYERLGVTTVEEFRALPSAAGQAEAAKQSEAKLARLTRENADLAAARDGATQQLTALRRAEALAQGMEGHRFRNPGDIRQLLDPRVVQEGDAFLYRTDDGKTVPIKEGVTSFALARPDYIEASGAGGGSGGFRGAQSAPAGNATPGGLAGDRAARVEALKARFPGLQ